MKRTWVVDLVDSNPIAVWDDEIPARSWLRMQPTFLMRLDDESTALRTRVRDAIEKADFGREIAMAGSVIDFRVPVSEQRFWSPHLSVQIHDLDNGRMDHQTESTDQQGPNGHSPTCELVARFSPRPEIWTMFVAIYGVMAIVSFGATIFASVQWLLGSPPWGLLLVPLSLAIIGCLHVASLVGQNLSNDQMQFLHARFRAILDSAR